MEKMQDEMDAPPVLLEREQRKVVEAAIREVCEIRNYGLHAVNVRTNHAHAVIAGQCRPERLADALKAYATRRLREQRLIEDGVRVWARGHNRRYL